MGIKGCLAGFGADLLAGTLRLGGKRVYRYFVDALWQRDRYQDDVGPEPLTYKFCAPRMKEPDPQERPLVERIFHSYRLAREQQRRVSSVYQPSQMWKNILRMSYGELQESERTNDLDRFHYFLANFASWPSSTAIEETPIVWKAAESPSMRRHLTYRIVTPLVRWWLRCESHGRGLQALVLPNYGNFSGVRVNGHLISTNSVAADMHARLVARLLDRPVPIIAELGGGFGRFAYFLSQHIGPYHYVAFDLPETTCCAAYFLMQAFPTRRFLLYGERDWRASSLTDYDALLLPSFEIVGLADQSIDLFVNENSLGEIDAHAARHFIGELCRTSRAIWHRNHESKRFTFADQSRSLLNSEYPIPATEFRERARYGDLCQHLRRDRVSSSSDMVWYYYERTEKE